MVGIPSPRFSGEREGPATREGEGRHAEEPSVRDRSGAKAKGLILQSATKTGIGQPVRRREDFRLLTGKGCYSDDFSFPGQAYAVMVRSPHAHALIRAVDTGEAAAAPGVLAVLTGRDLRD